VDFPYDCPLCSFQGTEEEVTTHFLTHANWANVPLTCLACGVSVSDRPKMDLHLATTDHQNYIAQVDRDVAPFMIIRGTEQSMRAYLAAKGLPEDLPLEEAVFLYVMLSSTNNPHNVKDMPKGRGC